MKNTGSTCIRHLARMNNKKNKSRSVLVFLVILLGTALLTAIMSYSVGIVKYEKISLEAEYGRFTGMLKNLTSEDLDKVLKDENFTELGLMYDCGLVESDATISLKALDEDARDLSCLNRRILSGAYPENSDEILLSEGLLAACGIHEAAIGDRITLPVRLDYSLPYEAMDYREGTGASGRKAPRSKSDKNGRKASGSKAGKGGTNASETKTSDGMRRGHESVTEFSLAMASLAANKKQTIVTMVTMGLSCVMLVVMMNCLGNIDTEYEARKEVPHGQFEISLDYTFFDSVYPENNLDVILSDNPLNQAFLEELKNIPGVTDVKTRDYLTIERENGQKEMVTVISREDFDFERDKGGAKGSLDYDQASEENQILFGWSFFMEDDGIEMAPMQYSLWNGQEQKEFSSEVAGSFGSLSGVWAITEDTYQHFGYQPGSSIGTIWVDCSEADRASVETAIRELMTSRKHLDLETYEQNYREQRFGTRVIRWSIYSMLIIIGFIGFMNMVNTMIISITTRSREYGIMQAVGMTGRQLNKVFTLQGLIYMGGTLVISMIVGIPLGYLAFVRFKSMAGFGMNVYHFPLLEIALMTVVMLVMQLTLSWVLSHNVKKNSLVERIRY